MREARTRGRRANMAETSLAPWHLQSLCKACAYPANNDTFSSTTLVDNHLQKIQTKTRRRTRTLLSETAIGFLGFVSGVRR